MLLLRGRMEDSGRALDGRSGRTRSNKCWALGFRLILMSVTPLFGVPNVTTVPCAEGVVHLAISRSASIRLASVTTALAELGIPQTAVDDLDEVERALSETRPAFALIAGDGDAAVTAAMTAYRLGVPIARVGAGLRCDDRTVEGELNRIVLDELAQRLYVDGDTAAERLHAEGFDEDRVVRAGSTLADSPALRRTRGSTVLRDLRLARGAYVLVAVTRDVPGLAGALSALATRTHVVLSAGDAPDGVLMSGPLAHADFLALQAGAGAVVTDSAGVQEETTILGVPCFTLGRSTERTLTLTHGTNVLLGDDPAAIAEVPLGTLPEETAPVPLWDGRAGRRIATDLAEWSAA
jgi:UDP-N-acetylglucosamine 2-epimerase (non-hydrolysing)